MENDKDTKPIVPSHRGLQWLTWLLLGGAQLSTLGHLGHQSYFGMDHQQARARLLENGTDLAYRQTWPSLSTVSEPNPSEYQMYENQDEANHDANQSEQTHGTISAADHQDQSGFEVLVTNGPTMQYRSFFLADLGEWTSSGTWWTSWSRTTTSSTTSATWTAATITTT